MYSKDSFSGEGGGEHGKDELFSLVERVDVDVILTAELGLSGWVQKFGCWAPSAGAAL